MKQEIEYIKIEDLVLWTENPRDPIDENATDQEIVDRALEDSSSKWKLSNLAKKMGGYYDFSELPTVVYHGDKPVVYDGNRRMILGKIKFGIVTIPYNSRVKIPDFPEKIPCNVCSKQIALKNVLRKHGDSGSWLPLERDIFLHKFMGAKKSLFLMMEEETGIISENPHLNQRFVRDEILKDETLKSMGFIFQNDKLHSVHSNDEAHSILTDISKKIGGKDITTRKNRGKIIEVLDHTSQNIIDKNKNKTPHTISVKFTPDQNVNKPPRQSKRTKQNITELFGGKLYLKMGEVSNLYRDIVDLHQFYLSKKHELSQTFPGLIRMSLRLLCETAAKEDNNKGLGTYLRGHFSNAKGMLDQDTKTTISNHNVSELSLLQLLNTGAHNYTASNNMEQTIAMSIIIGSILTISHGK